MDGPPPNQHGPPPAEAASAETRLKGHLAYLTPQEETAFAEFRQLAAKEGFYKPATDTTKASHDDGTLMYAVLVHLLLTADPTQADTCELESSSLRMALRNSRIRRSGANRTILMLSTRR